VRAPSSTLPPKIKVFFFEKKKQKTSASLDAPDGQVRDSEQKFFASFFQKRSPSFLPYAAKELTTGLEIRRFEGRARKQG
jgi:hypothetical protein